jgi:hypothetical protein
LNEIHSMVHMISCCLFYFRRSACIEAGGVCFGSFRSSLQISVLPHEHLHVDSSLGVLTYDVTEGMQTKSIPSSYSLRNDIVQLKTTTHCINEKVSMIFNNYICYNNLGLLGHILKVSIHKIRYIVIIITLIHRWHTRRSSGTTALGGHGTLQLGKIVYAKL